jgi:hypothetical protein
MVGRTDKVVPGQGTCADEGDGLPRMRGHYFRGHRSELIKAPALPRTSEPRAQYVPPPARTSSRKAPPIGSRCSQLSATPFSMRLAQPIPRVFTCG